MKMHFKFSFTFLVCVLALGGSVMRAWADTDYRCLNICASGGKPEALCMPQCTYDHLNPGQAPGEAPKPVAAPLPNHRILSTLQPADNKNIILKSQAASPYSENKNYHCIALCLQDKMQYETCERSCTTVTMKNGEPVHPSESKVSMPPSPGFLAPQSKSVQ